MKELFTLELFALNNPFICPNRFSSILEIYPRRKPNQKAANKARHQTKHLQLTQ